MLPRRYTLQPITHRAGERSSSQTLPFSLLATFSDLYSVLIGKPCVRNEKKTLLPTTGTVRGQCQTVNVVEDKRGKRREKKQQWKMGVYR